MLQEWEPVKANPADHPEVADIRKRRRVMKDAWRITEKAIRVGRLKRERCAICGRQDVEPHHRDHRRPLDVVWLCIDHHDLVTNKIIKLDGR